MTDYPQIADLVPHKAPMLLIDDIKALTPGTDITISTTVRADRPFHVNGKGWPAYIALELIAQSVAALTGHDGFIDGKPPQIGFLLGTRKMDIHTEWFPTGSQLEITATILLFDGNTGSAEGRVFCDGNLAAEARISVYQPDNAADMLTSPEMP